MTNRYVRSGGDAGAWTGTVASLESATSADAAGDVFYVAEDHNEYTGGPTSWTFAGTPSNPSKVLCGNKAASPPTTSAASAVVTTGNGGYTSYIAITGNVFVQGLKLSAGSSIANSEATQIYIGSQDNGPATSTRWKNCEFKLLANNADNHVWLRNWQMQWGVSGFYPAKHVWEDCTYYPCHTGNQICPDGAHFQWKGGGLHASAAAVTTLVLMTYRDRAAIAELDGLDLSYGDTNMTLCSFAPTENTFGRFVARNCKLPGSWSGSLTNNIAGLGQRAEMWNCDSGDTNYRMWVEDYAGSIKTETSKTMSGGASDGTTSYSWKMASSGNASFPLIVLESPEIAKWNDTTGSAVTVKIEIAQDSAGTALKDDEIWIELQYLGTSGVPKSTFITDKKSEILGSGSNQTTSVASPTWNNTTTPTKQELSVTFTPQEKGYLLAKVCLAAASKTVYVNPQLAVS